MNAVAFLGNYAPRCCGIATFTQDLRAAVQGARPSLHAPVAMISDDLYGYTYPEEVELVFDEKDRTSYAKTADALNRSGASVVSLQHEYGIYGGPSGVWLLDLLRQLRLPVVTTCHTVLRDPSAEQRRITCEIARRSARMVVMAEKGRELLRERYEVPDWKIAVIPHGIPNQCVSAGERAAVRKAQGWSDRHVLFTFGLLSPSKGIEHAVRALPEIVRRHPDALYVVAGATHPNLLREQGERYRDSLRDLAAELGVAPQLQFIDRFVSRDELVQLIAAADIYITPYLNEAQITSGTLAYAFGMGKPVISTPYWHAAELLANDNGVLVPFHDVDALAGAANFLISDQTAREAMSARAFNHGRRMTWQAVGENYAGVFAEAARSSSPRKTVASPGGMALPPLDHLQRLMGSHGLFQHAFFSDADPEHGYCTDDNARAAICLTDYMCAGEMNEQTNAMFDRCFDFLLYACDFRTDRFRNFMDKDGRWLERFGSEDSHGRALWALGHISRHHPSPRIREQALHVFRAATPVAVRFTSPRAWAFTMLGLTKYLDSVTRDRTAEILRDEFAGRLDRLYIRCADGNWDWFEDSITYDNARLPQVMLAAARQTGNAAWRRTGLRTLSFLVKAQTTPDGHFRAVGSSGFWSRDGRPAQWDQQPLEAYAMTAACLEAANVTAQPRWLEEAQRAMAWFEGGNDLGISVGDMTTGACCDGLQANGVNMNQGAESTLAWLQASAELRLAAMPPAVSGPPPLTALPVPTIVAA